MKSYLRGIWIAAALAVGGCNGDDIYPDESIPITYSYVQSGPTTVILLSTSAWGTLMGESASMIRITNELAYAEYSMLTVDLPCHGDDAEDIPPLQCWRRRIENGDTQIFARFCDHVSAVVTHLRLKEVFIIGESRGGYVAATCAALDPRITKIVLLKPVTDLQLLSEFNGYTVDESIFGLAATVPELSRRSVLLRIGPNDTRVGTESAIAYGDSIGAEVQVVESEGHKLVDDGTTVAWLLKD